MKEQKRVAGIKVVERNLAQEFLNGTDLCSGGNCDTKAVPMPQRKS